MLCNMPIWSAQVRVEALETVARAQRDNLAPSQARSGGSAAFCRALMLSATALQPSLNKACSANQTCCAQVREVALEAIARARRGEGPTLIEAETYRFRGHSLADPDELRKKEEKAHYQVCPTGSSMLVSVESAGSGQERLSSSGVLGWKGIRCRRG